MTPNPTSHPAEEQKSNLHLDGHPHDLSQVPTVPDHLSTNSLPNRELNLREEMVRLGRDTFSSYLELTRHSTNLSHLIAGLRDMPDFRSPHLDASTWMLLEMDRLFRATAGSITTLATTSPNIAVAYREFCNPTTDGREWRSRQDALRILIENDGAYHTLLSLCENVQRVNLQRIFQGPLDLESRGIWNANILESLRDVKESVLRCSAIGNDYVDTILDVMREATNSHLFQLAENGIAFSPRGIVPLNHGSIWQYIRPYAPFRADPATIGVTLGGLSLAATQIVPATATVDGVASLLHWGACLLGFGVFTIGSMGIVIGQPDLYLSKYFKRRALNDGNLQNFYEGLGRLQALLGWANFARSSKLPITFSQRDLSDSFRFSAQGLGKALDAQDPDYVLNDVYLDTEHLRSFTGPNGGGKSALQWSVVYSIWSSEVAGIATAKSLTYTSPERVIVHTPTIDRQADGMSRFQREVFELAKTIKSVETSQGPVLVILDEMFSSTAEDEAAMEALPQFAYIASLHKRPAVFLATHNRRLVHALVSSGVAEPLRMKWDEGNPTFVLEPGVCDSSHASAVVTAAEIDQSSLRDRLITGNTGDLTTYERLLESMMAATGDK